MPLGSHSEKIGLSPDLLLRGEITPSASPVTNGLVIELNKFASREKLPSKTLTDWLYKLQPKLKYVKESTLRMTLKRAVDTHKKYEHKKKVTKFESRDEFVNAFFINVTPAVEGNLSNKSQSPSDTETCSHKHGSDEIENSNDLHSLASNSNTEFHSPKLCVIEPPSENPTSSEIETRNSHPFEKKTQELPNSDNVLFIRPYSETETRTPHLCEKNTCELPNSDNVLHNCPYSTSRTPHFCEKKTPELPNPDNVLYNRPYVKENVDEKKIYNSIQYEILKKQKNLKCLQNLIQMEQDKLQLLRCRQGHYSVRNVEKRDTRAMKTRQELREAKSTILKQKSTINDYEKKIQNLKKRNRLLRQDLKITTVDNDNTTRSILSSEEHVQQLMTENNALQEKLVRQNTLNAKKNRSSSYFKKCLSKLRTGVKENGIQIKLKKNIKEKDVEIETLNTQVEILQEKLDENISTKKADGSFNDNVRLCVIELAGLEVATEKISKVMSTVSQHIFSRKFSPKDLPSDTTAQTIVDEGHYLAKLLIATKISLCKTFGINRDGTSRKKQKLLDTTVTLDTGDVISLGFTRVAHETAKTINDITKGHFDEMSVIQTDVNSNDFIKSSLQKLSFSMSDRASNEKAANKLLDDWKERTLQNNEMTENTNKIKHFHCMAHVLLGFHKYACDDVKSIEKKIALEQGPLGRDSLDQFKFWSKSGTVIERVVRTVSDIFAPAGDHRGVRDRWEAYCSENGVKSVIGNYKDNRFNGIFQTAAEILHHSDDMINVLDTVKSPNMKIASVKADLQCENVRLLLQCFSLFYIRVTGPYWDLITNSSVPYLKLFSPIQNLHRYLVVLGTKPDTIFNSITWDGNCTYVPNASLFEKAQECEKMEQLLSIIKVVSSAMVRCMEKQLNDFLPGGQFSSDPNEIDLQCTEYSQSTNLGCEHHFGDLDSSQKRRPNASIHHHSSIQLLKRNRNPLINWLLNMTPGERAETMKKARKGGKVLRTAHRTAEKNVLREIHNEMTLEKEKKAKKRKRDEVIDTCDKDAEDFQYNDSFSVNEYVVVAYQEGWYPGIVEQVDEKGLCVNFLAKTRNPGHYIWPQRKDLQRVSFEFVIKRGFVPECMNYGRLWLIKEHVDIQTSFEKYCKIYF